MKNTKLLLLPLLCGVAALHGCGSDTPATTAEQKKAFDGGPMPDSWKQKMAAAQGSGKTAAADNNGKAPAKGP